MKYLLFSLCLIFFIRCSSVTSDTKLESTVTEKREYIRQENLVDTLKLRKVPFRKELISNGKLKAVKKNELKFKVSGQLKTLSIKNGQRISSGNFIAILDPFEHQQKVDQAETMVQSALLELEDVLIGRGYYLSDSAKIDKNTFNMACLRSGYTNAIRDLKSAKYNLEGTSLKAPFTGKIANLKHRQFEQVNAGETFCTLIDDSEFEVEFHLVESEIKEININDVVKVTPFSLEESFSGTVSEINPLVDENGLVLVKAKVRNRSNHLIEGMNVKVSVAKTLPDQLVVPKTAVVLRQNQEVLFKLVDGKAFWIYVKTVQENSDSYIVSPHPEKGGKLDPGEVIIISGNLNLAHESEVKVK